MKTKAVLISVSTVICMLIYGYSAIEIDTGSTFGVEVNLSKPVSIVWPCEIAIVGDNGEKGLRIGPKVGRGWRGEAGGQAGYRFFVPIDGKYRIWAYCLWFDECANAIFTQVDELDRAIVGNDPIYNKWHWVRGFDVNLKKGTHSLLLSNHSDHIAVQKILLANSGSKGPTEGGLIFSDIFYDGFDGCDQGNFTNWSIISGTWHVQNPDSQTCLIENVLIGRSEKKSFIIYKEEDNWSSYSLDLAVKTIPSDLAESAFGICFGLKNHQNYYQLKIKANGNANKAKITILQKTASETVNLFQFSHNWNQNVWHQVQIRLNQNNIEIRIDDFEPRKILIESQITGGIGLLLEGKTTAYFDDIHVRKIIGEN